MKTLLILIIFLSACSNSNWHKIDIKNTGITVLIPIDMGTKQTYVELPTGLKLTKFRSRESDGYGFLVNVLTYPDAESAKNGARDKAPTDRPMIKQGRYEISGYQAYLQVTERDNLRVEFYKLIADKRVITVGFSYLIEERPTKTIETILSSIQI